MCLRSHESGVQVFVSLNAHAAHTGSGLRPGNRAARLRSKDYRSHNWAGDGSTSKSREGGWQYNCEGCRRRSSNGTGTSSSSSSSSSKASAIQHHQQSKDVFRQSSILSVAVVNKGNGKSRL